MDIAVQKCSGIENDRQKRDTHISIYTQTHTYIDRRCGNRSFRQIAGQHTCEHAHMRDLLCTDTVTATGDGDGDDDDGGGQKTSAKYISFRFGVRSGYVFACEMRSHSHVRTNTHTKCRYSQSGMNHKHK